MFGWFKKKPPSTPAHDANADSLSGGLQALLDKAFGMAGERVALGFSIERIAPTIAKLSGLVRPELKALMESTWPADSFHVGAIELFSPDRINQEHDDLLPGCVLIRLGFIGFGGNGAGSLYAQSVTDGKVYLFPPEYVTVDALYAPPWERMELSADNAKKIADQSWDSLADLFSWARIELDAMAAGDH